MDILERIKNKNETKEVEQHIIPKKQLNTVIPPKINKLESTIPKKKLKVPNYNFTLQKVQETPSQEEKTIGEVTYILPTFTKNAEDKSVYTNIQNLWYNAPLRKDLAVLLVFFDYIGSARILINYLYMVEKLKLADIPVFTLELVLEGKRPKISDAIHIYGSSYLFQKEHLIRLLEKQIPPEFTKIVCLDADVLFETPNWYNTLSSLLDTNDIVQCFNNAYWLEIDYKRFSIKAKTCLQWNKHRSSFWDSNDNVAHPGFGWAFTRNYYNKCGFFDLAIIGSGDTLFAYGILKFPISEKNDEKRIYSNSYEKWLETIGNPKYTFLDSSLYHLYHGPKVKRQYVSRYEAFKSVNQIEDVISINPYGAYELTIPELNSAMCEFFKTRDDDGID